MAFFKFGKKKEEPLDIPMQSPMPEMQPSNSPVEQVQMMKQQGYTNNQITQSLQGQGYNSSQISDAISQSSLSGNSQGGKEMGMPDYGQSYEQQPYPQPQVQDFQPPREISAPATVDEERIQEVTEAIIDEKWDEFANDIRKVIDWKEKSEDRIAKIEQHLIDLSSRIDSLSKGIMSKISAYDQNIVDVGTEIKAMEKVFQKVLPNLTENVNKLDRITKGYKDTQRK